MNRRSVGKPAVPRRIHHRGSTRTAPVGRNIISAFCQMPASATVGLIDPVPQVWRQDRTMLSGAAILQLVSDMLRQRLIAEFVDLGGGWPVSSTAENAALLQFLVSRLPDASHAFSLCRMEIALTCAATGAEIFVEPEYRSVPLHSKRDIQTKIESEAWACIERALQASVVTESWNHIERSVWAGVAGAVWDGIEREARSRLESDAWHILARSARNRIERGRYASLVYFHAQPELVLHALHGGAVPPVGNPDFPIVFGPGIPNLCRGATAEEAALWLSLPADDTAPELVERLLTEGIVRYSE